MDIKRDIYKNILEWKNNNSDKVLYVEGARQVGKTYIIRKFASENYSKVIYIDLTTEDGSDLLEIDKQIAQERLSGKLDRSKVNSLHELFRRFSSDFEDSEDCIIIIDEIQESAKIFSMIRSFAREFKTNFIVSGSYLGRIINDKSFWISNGDYIALTVNPISFEEFLAIYNLRELYNSLDFYGKSAKEDYDLISSKFQEYLLVGGYPQVVMEYIKDKNSDLDIIKENILIRFCEESFQYISENIGNIAVLRNSLSGVAFLLTTEKEGFKEDSFSEELKEVLFNRFSSNITKTNIRNAIEWLVNAKLIRFCDKVLELKYVDFKVRQRCYFSDIGLLRVILENLGSDKNEIMGILHENFIFNNLDYNFLRDPSFGIYKNGEIDFLHYNKNTQELYGIEVKAGKNKGKTITKALNDSKINKAIYCKGNTYGGIDTTGKIITIPIYLFPRFKREYLS
ncbi:AAA family ATPase [Clostridium sp. ZBS2]|uniref:AAA family ATPase n=1 Tax=Clostridium sp. ZBS2 TaxID=2949976 RepID=UPI00207956D5|nr:AAA family ATPase [Clostridium sp. ZBS2]